MRNDAILAVRPLPVKPTIQSQKPQKTGKLKNIYYSIKIYVALRFSSLGKLAGYGIAEEQNIERPS